MDQVTCQVFKNCFDCIQNNACIWIGRTDIPCEAQGSNFNGAEGTIECLPVVTGSNGTISFSSVVNGTTHDTHTSNIQSMFQVSIAMGIVLLAVLVVSLLGKVCERERRNQTSNVEAIPGTSTSISGQRDARLGDYTERNPGRFPLLKPHTFLLLR